MQLYRDHNKAKIFTWNTHPTYLYYLSQGDFEIYIPVDDRRSEGYYGRGETFSYGDNVIEVPANRVKELDVDCILYQTNKNFFIDQYEMLSDEQRQLSRIYLEHDPPSLHPTDTPHPMNDPDVILVHVTHYNKLMWNNHARVIKVIEHGVLKPDVPYNGRLEKGIVVINHMHRQGRKLGADIFDSVRRQVPLDLIGIGTSLDGGLGEVLHHNLSAFTSQYRFLFNPMRYTSFGLAVCEAMMMGMPVVALATTECNTVIKNGITGFVHTDIDYLVEQMKMLLKDPSMASAIGLAGQQIAEEKFDIERFKQQWMDVFQLAIKNNKTYETRRSLIHSVR
jgi:glycosyltransferase involved in cell wall biosynthesis